MWNVLILEDDPRMQAFFSACVARSGQLAVAGEVSCVADARDWLDQPGRRVDVLLVDLGLPDGSGLEVIRHAARTHPGCESLVVSMFGDDESVLASIEAGALGYIHKDARPEDIAQTILEMKAGASPISPMIARRVLSRFQALTAPLAPPPIPQARQPGGEPATGSVGLSRREQDVLELIARGFSYAEIGELHGVTVHTVRSHIKNLYAKLAVHSRSEAVFEAAKLGLLPRFGGRAA